MSLCHSWEKKNAKFKEGSQRALWMELVVESPQSQATGSTPDVWVEGEGFWFGLLEV